MLCIIHLITENFHPLTNIYPLPPPTPTQELGNHSFPLFFSEFFKNSSYWWDHTVLSFFIWLISLSIMSRLIHDVAKGGCPSFLWIIIYNIFFIYLPHSSSFLILAIVSSAAMNMGVEISLQDTDFIPFRYTQKWDC